MSDRGAYRATFEALSDDLDFQDLSFAAQAVFGSLKRKLGQYGIGVFYTAVLYELHRKESPAAIDAALAELEAPKPGRARGWITRERNVVWIVNGLRYEPSLTLSNANHANGARKYAATLPKVGLVAEFMAYYGLATPADGASAGDQSVVTTPSASHPHPIPHPMPIPGGITETERDTETTQRSLKGGDEPAAGSTAADAKKPPKKPASPRKASKPKGEPAPWMAELRPIWRQQYGGDLPDGAAKTLRPLVDEHGIATVAAHLATYVARTAADFTSLPKFVATFGTYAPGSESARGASGNLPALSAQASADDIAVRREAQALLVTLRNLDVIAMDANRATGVFRYAIDSGTLARPDGLLVFRALWGTDSGRVPPADGGALRQAVLHKRDADAVRGLEALLRARATTTAPASEVAA